MKLFFPDNVSVSLRLLTCSVARYQFALLDFNGWYSSETLCVQIISFYFDCGKHSLTINFKRRTAIEMDTSSTLASQSPMYNWYDK